MAISKKLETIYHNGQPDGIRSIRRNLSTMTGYVIPRPLLSEAKNRGFKEIYLKTNLKNYYEKFGAIFIKQLKSNENLYRFEL